MTVRVFVDTNKVQLLKTDETALAHYLLDRADLAVKVLKREVSDLLPTEEQELVQELVTVAVDGVRLYEQGVGIVISRAMSNYLEDFKRNRGRRSKKVKFQPLPDDDVRTPGPLTAPGPEELLAAQWEVQEIFDQPWLTERQREILGVLKECGGDIDDAAFELGVARAVVDNHLSRIRKRLRGEAERESA